MQAAGQKVPFPPGFKSAEQRITQAEKHRHSGLSGIGFIGGFDHFLRYSARQVTLRLKPDGNE
ncbi:hypothetical protein ISS30_08510 [bacterium]|nr:hypothetical protein [bacterium]